MGRAPTCRSPSPAALIRRGRVGHCILGQARGVDDATAAHLIDLKAPADGQAFQPDKQPFGSPAKP